MGSSSSQPANANAVVPLRPLPLHELIRLTIEGDRQDPYALLGFPRYSSPPKEEADRAFRLRAFRHHPDKLHDATEEEKLVHKDIFLILSEAHEMLLNPALKAKYDELLKRKHGEWSWSDWIRKWGRCLLSGAMLGVGVGLVVASLCTPAAPAGAVAGAAIAYSVTGGALAAAGGAGLYEDLKDPHQSAGEFAFKVAMAALAGAASGGVIEAVAAAAVAQAGVAATAGAIAAGDVAAGVAATVPAARAVRAAQLIYGVALAALPAISEAVSTDRFCDEILPAKRRPWPYRLLCDHGEEARPKRMSGKVIECLENPQQVNFAEGGVVPVNPENRRDYTELAQTLRDYLEPRHGFQSMAAVKAYTTETLVYPTVNGALKYGSFAAQWDFANFTHNMRLEMKYKASQSSWYTSPEPLWRGTIINNQDLQKWAKVGCVFLNTSFMSTSKDRAVAEGFMARKGGNALIQVDCSQNGGAQWGLTYAVDIEDVSMCGRQEREVLFYPFSGFKVVEVNRRNDVYYIRLHTLDTLIVESQA